MSRGKWTAETYARRGGRGSYESRRAAAARKSGQPVPHGNYGANHNSLTVEPWANKRAEARAKAAAATKALRDRILMERDAANRDDALARGVARYIGKPCPWHDNGGERYTASCQCVVCADKGTAAERPLTIHDLRPSFVPHARKEYTEPLPIIDSDDADATVINEKESPPI
jgi:hypothetical protein